MFTLTIAYGSLALKHVAEAMEGVETRSANTDRNLSVMKRILLAEPEPRIAFVAALDVLLVALRRYVQSCPLMCNH